MDKQEFSARVIQAEKMLYCVARGYLRSDSDCADCVQEALLKAWAAFPRLKHADYFETWLTRILINECKSCLRRQKRMLPMDELPDPGTPPPETNDALEMLDTLEPKYREVAVLRFVMGYSMENIAKVLRLPVGTVKSRLFRAKNQLRMTIGKEAAL